MESDVIFRLRFRLYDTDTTCDFFCIFFLMIRRPPRSTRTDTLFPTRRSSDLARSTTSMPRFLASSITVWRVSPLRKQSGDGVWRTPSFTKRSEEHTSELQSLMRISYAVFCLKKKKKKKQQTHNKHKINAH